jgi:hypothetical protein
MSEDVRFTRVIDAAPEAVFDAFTGENGQEAFYSERGWTVESECDLRVGGVWTVTFGPSRDEFYRHRPRLPGDRPAQSPPRRHDREPARRFERRVRDRVHLRRA